jgi:hypothetical protein
LMSRVEIMRSASLSTWAWSSVRLDECSSACSTSRSSSSSSPRSPGGIRGEGRRAVVTC